MRRSTSYPLVCGQILALCLVLLCPQWVKSADAGSDASSDTASDAASGPAGVGLRAQATRSYQLPPSLNLAHAQILAADDGRTIIAASVDPAQVAGQAGEDSACTVVVVDDATARAFSYRYRGESTACLGVSAHPDGGFFVRGMRLMSDGVPAEPGDITGFTARIDADGREVWAVDDQALIDAKRVSEQGTGAFSGEYLGPQAQLAYHQATDKLLAFSLARLRGAGNPRMSRAHVIDGQSGELRVSGLSFDTGGTFGVVVNALSREPTRDFLVHTASTIGLSVGFFTYNGRRSVQVFRPPGGDWQDRFVHQLHAGDGGHLSILSTIAGEPGADLAVLDAEGQPLWARHLEDSLDGIDLGEPGAIWAAGDYMLVYYPGAPGSPARILDASDGQALGTAAVSMLSEYGVMAMLSRADGALTMLSLDLQAGIVHEYRVEVLSGSAPTPPDAGGADASADAAQDGPIRPSSPDSGGCATPGAAPALPASWPALAFCLAVITIACRRRAPKKAAHHAG